MFQSRSLFLTSERALHVSESLFYSLLEIHTREETRSRTRDRERDRATERDRETDSERERSCASQATISQHLHSVLTGYHLLPPPPPSSPEEINEPANFNSFISHHSLLLLAPVSCSFPPISSLRLVLSPSLHS